MQKTQFMPIVNFITKPSPSLTLALFGLVPLRSSELSCYLPGGTDDDAVVDVKYVNSADVVIVMTTGDDVTLDE